MLCGFLVVFTRVQHNSWSEFRRNFCFKSGRIVVSIEEILLSLVYQRNEIPNRIFHAFKFFEIICLVTANLFVSNIPCHKIQGVFDILSIRCDMLGSEPILSSSLSPEEDEDKTSGEGFLEAEET